MAGEPPPDAEGVPDHLRPAAEAMFGDRLPLACAYAGMLDGTGVERGLIGPREAPRIWDRHLLNCAAVAELVPPQARVVDVGSGAGLPGLVLALCRTDISTILVEPLARRVTFLTEVVDRLALGEAITVVRARAEELGRHGDGVPAADVVTARAVAPLDRLVRWCLPLAAVGGSVLALKGSSAAEEVAQHDVAVRRAGGSAPVLRQCGVGLIEPPTTVVEVVRQRDGIGPTRSTPRGPTPAAERRRSASRQRGQREDRRGR